MTPAELSRVDTPAGADVVRALDEELGDERFPSPAGVGESRCMAGAHVNPFGGRIRGPEKWALGGGAPTILWINNVLGGLAVR